MKEIWSSFSLLKNFACHAHDNFSDVYELILFKGNFVSFSWKENRDLNAFVDKHGVCGGRGGCTVLPRQRTRNRLSPTQS